LLAFVLPIPLRFFFSTVSEQEHLYTSIQGISFNNVKTMIWSYICWRWQLLRFLSVNIKSTSSTIVFYLA